MQIAWPKMFHTPHVRVTAPHSKEAPGLAFYEAGLGELGLLLGLGIHNSVGRSFIRPVRK